MPRGKYTNHKGRNRRFTNTEELEEQRKKDEYRARRRERGMESSEEEEEEEAGSEDGSGSESDEGGDGAHHKAKGVENLIEISNPNRAPPRVKKAAPTAAAAAPAAASNPADEPKPELSRREREEIEKQRASAHYHMLHSQGKTAEARADLARLAIIKQQREEAAKKREAEKAEREAVKSNKTALTQKALGKKT
ncbi:28 kDa heat- and acid-stable [Nesidiocoris tenuis]|uniref:28 kDa heat- and acid-stable n=1 Tax=Nesidiocoris tenuis TaxID=355587 RepID=A0ABN7BEL2_9HEMI|nr:28 kDa heat- and acid-stable [Nesidiocoris tenuis]